MEPIWAKHGRVYQTWKQEKYRIKHFQKYTAPLFTGMRVLDIGCNAGLQALALDGIVDKYYGLEPDPSFAAQFNETKRLIKGHAKCIQDTNVSINAVLASYVLYHLSDDQLRDLAANVLPQCKLVVIYTNTKTRKVRKNSYDLFNPDNVVAYLISAGFKDINCQYIRDKSIHISVTTQ